MIDRPVRWRTRGVAPAEPGIARAPGTHVRSAPDRRRTVGDVPTRIRDLLRWRPTGPVTWAALAGAVLAVLGLTFVVVAPLAAGPARTDSLPVTRPAPVRGRPPPPRRSPRPRR